MNETDRQPEITPESVGVLAAFASLAGYDPIAEAEEEGRQAYFDGYTLRETIEEYGIDTDTDPGAAFAVAFKNAAAEPPRQG